MSISKTLSSTSTALLNVVPDVVRVVSMTGQGLGNVAESFAMFTGDNLDDQKLLMSLKSDYREVVRKDSKAAVSAGDKESIKAAYKAAIKDFEEFED